MPVAAAAIRPHRVPAPATEPPYDEPSRPRPSGPAPTQGTLALTFASRATASRPALRVVPDPPAEPATATGGPPAVKGWAEAVAVAMAQILTGERTAAQFKHWALPEVVDALSRRAALAATAVGPRRRAVLRAVHVCLPTEGVAEVCTVIHGLARPRALAFRLEARRTRWVCTALDLG